MSQIGESFLLSLIAGSATGIGGLIVLQTKNLSKRYIGFSMGFASGIMLTISFLNLFAEALRMLTYLNAVFAFSVGALLMIFLDLALPHMELGRKEKGIVESKLFKTGLLVAIGISLHNIPEGLVVSAGYAHLPRLGVLIAIAIFAHNIPEGIATAVPLLMARTKGSRIAGLTFLSGLAETLGALIGSSMISFLGATDQVVGDGLAFAAGVMTYITVDELIPIAHEHGHKHAVSVGLLLGVIFPLFLLTILQ